MFTKAGLLIALLLVYLGYRWGTRKAQALSRPAQPAAPVAPPPAASTATGAAPTATPRKEVLTLKVLLGVAIVLLIIAILSSLQR